MPMAGLAPGPLPSAGCWGATGFVPLQAQALPPVHRVSSFSGGGGSARGQTQPHPASSFTSGLAALPWKANGPSAPNGGS